VAASAVVFNAVSHVKVGRGYRFSFSCSVTDIEILADLTACNCG
jgi:hypothetical protein